MKNLNYTLNEITEAFKYLNEELFENKLPETVLVIQSKKAGSRKAMGWFTLGKNWTNMETGVTYHEITVCSETLNQPLSTILEVLVHEMVHLENKSKGIVDCDPGQFHNENFKIAAERALLVCTYSKRYGYGYTRPSAKLKNIFEMLPIDKSAFNLAVDDTATTKSNNYFMYRYACDGCGIKFKTKANLAPNAICGTCGGQINKISNEEEADDDE